MIRGYLLALCTGSALDKSSNNFTLFNLIERVSVPADLLAQPLPFELHYYFFVDPSARNTDFEMRVVRTDENGTADPGDALPVRTNDSERFRMRAMAFRLPKAFGQYRLHLEWRRRGEVTWNVDPLVWPLSIDAPARQEPTAEAAAMP